MRRASPSQRVDMDGGPNQEFTYHDSAALQLIAAAKFKLRGWREDASSAQERAATIAAAAPRHGSFQERLGLLRGAERASQAPSSVVLACAAACRVRDAMEAGAPAGAAPAAPRRRHRKRKRAQSRPHARPQEGQSQLIVSAALAASRGSAPADAGAGIEVGRRMLVRMGWDGGGLGTAGQGITQPLSVRYKRGKAGLGMEAAWFSGREHVHFSGDEGGD